MQMQSLLFTSAAKKKKKSETKVIAHIPKEDQNKQKVRHENPFF